MNDEEIRAECLRRDGLGNHLIYFISTDTRTFKLVYVGVHWLSMIEGERWCIVKNRNIFDSIEDCKAAIARALQPA
jgi:hypothetical protein